MDANYNVEVHPESGLPLIDWEGGIHGLGCLRRNLSAHNNRYPPLSKALPPIPESEFTEQDFEPFAPKPYDQGQTSACGGHAEAAALDTAIALVEDERPRLSAFFAYGLVNGGRDQGSSIPDLLHAAETTGICLESTVPPGRVFGPYPKAAYEEAKRFKIETAYDLASWPDYLSAFQRNFPVVCGIDIGGQFEPSADGVLPDFKPSREGVLGHAICLIGKKKINGRWYAKMLNSWGSRWGIRGCAYLPESYHQRTFGAWAVRCVRPDPLDPTPSPSVS
jgi:hypothetical protein